MKLNWSPRIKLNTTGVSDMKATSGVYRLMYLDPDDGNFYVFHVGQSENLKRDLSKHLPWREQNPHCQFYLRNYKCFFRAATVEEKVQRDRTEIALYKYFLPPCLKLVSFIQPARINFE